MYEWIAVLVVTAMFALCVALASGLAARARIHTSRNDAAGRR
jgi:hypothetical protein